MSLSPGAWQREDINRTTTLKSFVGRGSVLTLGVTSYICTWLVAISWCWKGLGVRMWPDVLVSKATVSLSMTNNIMLLGIIGLLYSVLSSRLFKKMFSFFFPSPSYKSFCCMISLIFFIVIEAAWKTSGPVVWRIYNHRPFFVFVYIMGLAATFLPILWALDHFELLGLRQAIDYQCSTSQPAPVGNLAQLYNHNRLPVLIGPLLLLWSLPVMTVDRLLWALTFTSCIIGFSGITYEDVTFVAYLQETGAWPPKKELVAVGSGITRT